jgi:hypothetical protein
LSISPRGGRADEVRVAEPGTAEIDLLETRAGKILLHEIGHGYTQPPRSDTYVVIR